MSRKVNQSGIDLIHVSEGCRLEAYPDPASPLARERAKPEAGRVKGWQQLSGAPWTVGYGATGVDRFNLDAAGKPTPIGPGTKWTQEQCEQRSKEDIDMFGQQVLRLVKAELTDNQFAAVVSFAYNVGIGNLRNSGLLRMLNQGKYGEAADQFLLWNKAKGKVMLGLTRRREAERRLFLTA
jgi:lysozyme